MIQVNKVVIASINSRVPAPSWRAGSTSLIRESFSEVEPVYLVCHHTVQSSLSFSKVVASHHPLISDDFLFLRNFLAPLEATL